MHFNASGSERKKRNLPVILSVAAVLLLILVLLAWKLPSLLTKDTDGPDATSTASEAVGSETAGLYESATETEEAALTAKASTAPQDTINDEQLEAENAAAYREAEALLAGGDEQAAYKAFSALGDYQDSRQRAERIYGEATGRETMTKANVGDYIIFGKYEQDSNRTNGSEWIEWLVLAKEEDRILVISRYVLVSRAYDAALSGCTWARSPLRDFLNGSFLNIVFSEEEQDRIPVVTVAADPNPSFDTDPGSDTQDRVFLLSVVETDRYFSSDESRKCLATATAVAQGLYLSETHTLNGTPTCFWWLRQAGRNMKTTACIDADGTIHPSGYFSDEEYVGVRPAIWIDIS